MQKPGKYDDILELPHPVSRRHPQMPLADRAAQFAPFAALTGHDEAIQETARLTDSRVELEEGQKEALDQRLGLLLRRMRENPNLEPEVLATYFKPDEKKEGGAYRMVCGRVRKVDEYERSVTWKDGTTLPVEDIVSMEGDIFRDTE